MSRQLTGGNVQEGNFLGAAGTAGAGGGGGMDSDSDDIKAEKPVNVCMIGTGEYTTGYVHGGASDSDKGAGGGWGREVVREFCCYCCTSVSTAVVCVYCCTEIFFSVCCPAAVNMSKYPGPLSLSSFVRWRRTDYYYYCCD